MSHRSRSEAVTNGCDSRQVLLLHVSCNLDCKDILGDGMLKTTEDMHEITLQPVNDRIPNADNNNKPRFLAVKCHGSARITLRATTCVTLHTHVLCLTQVCFPNSKYSVTLYYCINI